MAAAATRNTMGQEILMVVINLTALIGRRGKIDGKK
jgi:hypothetical protein